MASPDSFFRSTSFRLLAWYAAVFGASVAVLLLIVYWTTLATLDDQLSDSIERESQVLVELYRGGGIERTARAIQLRVADLRPPRRYYLLQSAAGERVAGNLPPMAPRAVAQEQLNLYGARVARLRMQSERLVQRVNLYLALGGGFEQRPAEPQKQEK